MQDCSCNHSRWRCCTHRFHGGNLQSGRMPEWLHLRPSGHGSHVQRQVFAPALLPGIVLHLMHSAPRLAAAYHLEAALSGMRPYANPKFSLAGFRPELACFLCVESAPQQICICRVSNILSCRYASCLAAVPVVCCRADMVQRLQAFTCKMQIMKPSFVLVVAYVSWLQGCCAGDCYATHRAYSPGLPLYLEISREGS